MVSVVLAGGGTAGHTSPLIATAEALKAAEHYSVGIFKFRIVFSDGAHFLCASGSVVLGVKSKHNIFLASIVRKTDFALGKGITGKFGCLFANAGQCNSFSR